MALYTKGTFGIRLKKKPLMRPSPAQKLKRPFFLTPKERNFARQLGLSRLQSPKTTRTQLQTINDLIKQWKQSKMSFLDVLGRLKAKRIIPTQEIYGVLARMQTAEQSKLDRKKHKLHD